MPRRTDSRAGDGGGFEAGFEEGAFVEFDVVGGDVERVDALRLHVADEVGEVAAVGFDRVVREQSVADPGDERAAAGAASPQAARAWVRKASTLLAAGESPSRKSVRSASSGGAFLGGTTSSVL